MPEIPGPYDLGQEVRIVQQSRFAGPVESGDVFRIVSVDTVAGITYVIEPVDSEVETNQFAEGSWITANE